ncbi:monofunctional biosynthetic peptidoglycan transglycosylase [Methyloceanibacter sp.]|uniref:monofunctional biosynthetic peptidoglycan transglycosylase n=1 Tax=Methyloceanibacter sp. TaxID=1965321 RepID=UPI002B70A4D4|nr:monofunctional biosynthetic peptidoglycan transglycosylase [Methyloceanibacter sp.]HML92950.1 monofunctional biosynthetic peptidoglycan transglycosylase [Methyloceanibacter sp.]
MSAWLCYRAWLRGFSIIAVLLIAALVVGIVAFRVANPGITPVAVAQTLNGQRMVKQWIPLAKMSRDLPVAVIASEDGRFCDHWGVDWPGVKDALVQARSISGLRGASTIPMQLAKNLFLWAERDYLRKAIEMPLAYLLTALWPKPVIIESYLNIAPWGPNIVGAEAASRYYFYKSAEKLDRQEAILLAISLPSPILRNPAKPSPKMLKLAKVIDARMRSLAPRYSCVSP